MPYAKLVKPGSTVKLKDINPGKTDGMEKPEAEERLLKLGEKLRDLHRVGRVAGGPCGLSLRPIRVRRRVPARIPHDLADRIAPRRCRVLLLTDRHRVGLECAVPVLDGQDPGTEVGRERQRRDDELRRECSIPACGGRGTWDLYLRNGRPRCGCRSGQDKSGNDFMKN